MVHGHSGHPIAHPIQTAATLVLALRNSSATSDTILSAVPHGSKWYQIRSANITKTLRLSAFSMAPSVGTCLEDSHNLDMCAGSAMKLLLGGIDYNKIKLLG